MFNAYARALTLDLSKTSLEGPLVDRIKRNLIKRGTWFDRQIASGKMSDMY